MNIELAIKSIDRAEDTAGGIRADKLENAIHFLMKEYTEQLREIGTSEEHIAELVSRDWINDETIMAVR